MRGTAEQPRGLTPAEPPPANLHDLGRRCAERAGLAPGAWEEVLVTRYAPGDGIGWHRDAGAFGPVVAGVSLAADAVMRFQRRAARGERRVFEQPLARRSAYVPPAHLGRRGTTASRPWRRCATRSATGPCGAGRRPQQARDIPKGAHGLRRTAPRVVPRRRLCRQARSCSTRRRSRRPGRARPLARTATARGLLDMCSSSDPPDLYHLSNAPWRHASRATQRLLLIFTV